MSKHLYQVLLFPEDEGSYRTEVPDLPGCFSCGDTYLEAVANAADAARTYVAALLADGDPLPAPTRQVVPEGAEGTFVFFQSDPSWLVSGSVVSAAEAARRLHVTPARVTRLIDTGALDGYREGRHTFVTEESIEARIRSTPQAGRPRKIELA
ncbi:MAG: helix-turn-helix domain-containing protein [Eggerthellaceae bacterium]|nr:helix-turn-helix domain-containing protein [Eggerthellaceae bacterium]